MAKVKWDARSDYEYINNYKILQRVFQKNKVEKVRVAPGDWFGAPVCAWRGVDGVCGLV